MPCSHGARSAGSVAVTYRKKTKEVCQMSEPIVETEMELARTTKRTYMFEGPASKIANIYLPQDHFEDEPKKIRVQVFVVE